MNVIKEKIGDHHLKIRIAMNSSTELQEWRRAVPYPLPATHAQCFEWGKIGNGIDCLDIYPAPHPLEIVAQVTEHFASLDATQLRLLCDRAKIDQAAIDAHITAAAKADKPETLTEQQAMIALLREAVPMPKGAKVLPVPKATEIRERVIIVSAELAAMSEPTLEKEAARRGGINAFKAAKNRGATISELRALVAKLMDRQKENAQRDRQGAAGVLQRA